LRPLDHKPRRIAAHRPQTGSIPISATTKRNILIAGLAILAIIAINSLRDSPDSDSESAQATHRYREQLLGLETTPPNPPTPASSTQNLAAIQPEPPADPKTFESNPAPVPIPWRTEHIRSGDSFAIAMQRLGHSASTVANIMLTGPAAKQLSHLKPDHLLELYETESGLEQVRYEITPLTRLEIDLTTEPPEAKIVDLPVETRFRHATADIDSSLYLAGKDAGLSDSLIMELANIFGWDVDFTLDLRQGDRFTVVYSELYLDAEKITDGQIYAAELITRQRQIQAVRYEKQSGAISYYAPDGKSMRKAFSRNPLPITRVTSRFNPNRLHPIFKTRRPHRGVDYGAASGTPVRSTGDGKILFRGKKSGYGNTIIIQHGQRYTTLYAHLKSFSRKIRQGSSVKQGQTIAFVGQSGWATGPHLHYEFRVNGVHKNPLTVKLPAADPIRPGEKRRFLAQVKPYIEQLNALSSQQPANN